MSTYQEPEISTAAFLLCRGYRVTGVKDNPARSQQKFFVFEDPQATASTTALEFANNAHVPARDYSSAMTFLKDMLYTRVRATERR